VNINEELVMAGKFGTAIGAGSTMAGVGQGVVGSGASLGSMATGAQAMAAENEKFQLQMMAAQQQEAAINAFCQFGNKCADDLKTLAH
jgi:hypothetical protein